MIEQLFGTQNQMLAAQLQVASLPSLCIFDGQSDPDNDEFDLWLECFDERAKLTNKTKLCQLRLHLSKVAGHALQMFPKEGKSSYMYIHVFTSLKKQFRLVEREEL